MLELIKFQGQNKDKTKACRRHCSVGGIHRTRDCTAILPVPVLHLSRNQNADGVDEDAAQPQEQQAFEHPALSVPAAPSSSMMLYLDWVAMTSEKSGVM